MNNIKVIRFLIIVLVLVHCYTYMHAESADSSLHNRGLLCNLISLKPIVFPISCPITPFARIRLGLDVRLSIDNDNGSNSYEYSNSDTSYTQQSSIPRELKSFSGTVTLSALYLCDFISSSYFSLYAGVGPYVTYSRSYSSYKDSYIRDTTTSENDYSSSSYSWTYGATVALGIQIVITREIGLHAEYGFSAGLSKINI